jgi:hypothetical protein
MKIISKLVLLPAIAFASFSSMAQLVNGTPFTDFVGSLGANNIQFATDTGYNWHPFGLGSFGAVITGCIDMGNFPGSSSFQFSLNSDDGSKLYIDNLLVVDNGGPHSPTVASGVANLSGGIHEVRVEFFEDFGGESGVDLFAPQFPINYVPCPDRALPDGGTTGGLLALSSLGLLGFRRRFGHR